MKSKVEFQDFGAATSATFLVDHEKFTEELAMIPLDFFGKSYPKDEIIKQGLIMYAAEAIHQATIHQENATGVINRFAFGIEGYNEIDGRHGIQLISVTGYEVEESNLDLTLSKVN